MNSANGFAADASMHTGNDDGREEQKLLPVVPIEAMFGILQSAHQMLNHFGRDKMHEYLKRQYANITEETIAVFLKFCHTCEKTRDRPQRKGHVSRPIISKAMNSRCQVDLIDLQRQACGENGEYKWILNYQDNLTKFVILRALKSKSAVEVADKLIEIWCEYGSPLILHMDNGREFKNQVMKALADRWKFKIVHGLPRNSQAQGSVEAANKTVEKLLFNWMEDNNTLNWKEGLKYVMYSKNQAMHSGIGRSPYAAMFGETARTELTSLLPQPVLDSLETEEDLEQVSRQ